MITLTLLYVCLFVVQEGKGGRKTISVSFKSCLVLIAHFACDGLCSLCGALCICIPCCASWCSKNSKVQHVPLFVMVAMPKSCSMQLCTCNIARDFQVSRDPLHHGCSIAQITHKGMYTIRPLSIHFLPSPTIPQYTHMHKPAHTNTHALTYMHISLCKHTQTRSPCLPSWRARPLLCEAPSSSPTCCSRYPVST